MGEKVVEINQENLEEQINTDVPVIIDFWAEWCVPCKRILPVIDELADEMGGKLKFLKVDVDNNQDIAAHYQVMSIPTLVFLQNGQELERVVGATSKDSLMDKINTVYNM